MSARKPPASNMVRKSFSTPLAFAALVAGSFGVETATAQAVTPSPLESRVNAAMEFTSLKLNAKVLNGALAFHWINGGERFWYKKTSSDGSETFLAVDAATGKQQPLFDAAAMSAALVRAGAPSTNGAPRLYDASVADSGATIRVDVPKPDATCRWPQLYDKCELPVQQYECDLPVSRCIAMTEMPAADVSLSPDGRYVVRAQNHDLWLHDNRGGGDRRLTNDGVQDFAYGEMHDQIETFAASRRRVGLPEPLQGVRWSPDGRYIVALRHDVRPFRNRLVLTEYLPPEGGPPIVHSKREAAAEDDVYPAADLSIISIEDGSVKHVQVDPHSFDDLAGRYFNMSRFGNGGTAWWDMPRDKLWLIGSPRGGLAFRLFEIDLRTGSSRTLLDEASRVPVYLNPNGGALPNIAILPTLRQFIWYSERDGWGHLYLYNLDTGRQIRQLTKGPWVVTDLVRVDEAKGNLYFAAAGVKPGENPYYRHLYSMPLAGGAPKILTPDEADHGFASGESGSMSPNGSYFIDNFSTVALPDRYVLRRTDGTKISEVAAADISRLQATGWHPPEEFTVKAADGQTDLYGVLYKPTNFDPSKKYPIIEITYPEYFSKYHPTTFKGQFYGSAVQNANAFAQLGAIVISVDGRGSSFRSAEFRSHYYLKDDVTGAEDHVAAIRNAAATRPYMDLSRVGATGHSSGGDGSLRAAMLYPDFFKVVVSGEGPTNYLTLPMDIAVERPLGVPNTPEMRSYYERIATRNLVRRLTPKNKVMVIYGGADEEVPLQQGFEIFRAFQEADFVYDELIVPDAGHWGGRNPYGVMRTARYFAEHLGGAE